MIPKPTILPEWATDPQIDPISGQENVVEPPLEKKMSGWTFQEKPNRQWWNWLHRQTYLWIAYFNENLDFESDTLIPTWDGLDVIPSTNNFFYSRQGDIVYFTCKMQYSANTDVANGLAITNLPFSGKTQAGFSQTVPCIRSAEVSPVTAPTGNQLACLIPSASNRLKIMEIDNSTGLANELIAKGAAGQLTITGFYFTN